MAGALGVVNVVMLCCLPHGWSSGCSKCGHAVFLMAGALGVVDVVIAVTVTVTP